MKWQIGEVTVSKIVELTSSSIGKHILPDATPERLHNVKWIQPFVDEDYRMILSFHALVVETPSCLIIVDTCIGNDKERSYPRWNRMQTSFLDDLQSAGFKTEGFDKVLCTHMHVDHVGWNTFRSESGWVPTFSNARYLYAQSEWDHWSGESQAEYGPVIEDSVQPIFDRGLADLVPSDHQVCPEVSLIPTPGHTPGHVSVLIESQGEVGVITGDIFHHPCQIAYPHWCATADLDQGSALETRERFLARFSSEPALVIGTHFAGVTAGRLARDGESYRLDY